MDNWQGSPPLKRMMCKKNSSSVQSVAAAIIGGNDDLLIEIFLLLPPRSLIRFKLVSKHWCSLISTHSFARLHTLHQPLRGPEPQKSFILSGSFPQFFICHSSIKRLVPFHFKLPYVRLLQSCNGLLLLECKYSPFGATLVYTIFNPATMQSRILIKRETPLLLGLFFDPSKSPYYRVVCFERSNAHDDTRQLSIYNSQTNTWKEEGTSQIRSAQFSNGVYWNNTVYFFRYIRRLFCLFSDGSFSYIAAPPMARLRGAEILRYIMEAGGRLHYLVLSLKKNDNCLIVYELNGDGSDWLIKYTADFNPISVTVRNFKCSLIGLIRGEGEREDSMVMFHMPGKIMIYKFVRRSFNLLVNLKTEEYYEEGGELQFGFAKPAFPFIGTLAHV